MRECKPHSFGNVGFDAEGEIGSGEIVEDEAHHVSYRVGNTWRRASPKQQINQVLNSCCQYAYYTETYNLAQIILDVFIVHP
jgi:hypothetical protein